MKLPPAISDLVSEYSEEGTFRIPKDVTALQLHFTYKGYDSSTGNRVAILEVPCRSGLWVIEETPYIYLDTRAIILRPKETVLPLLEGKIAFDETLLDVISRLDICTKDKALFSTILNAKGEQVGRYSGRNLLGVYQLGTSAFALIMVYWTGYNAMNILDQLMMESIIRANPTLPLRIIDPDSDYIEDEFVLDVTSRDINKYMNKPYDEGQLSTLNAGRLILTTGILLTTYDIYDSDGKLWDNVYDESFNHILYDILRAVLLFSEEPDTNYHVRSSRLFEIYPTIKEAYKQIVAGARKGSTYKDFLHLLPLVPYNLLVSAGKQRALQNIK